MQGGRRYLSEGVQSRRDRVCAVFGGRIQMGAAAFFYACTCVNRVPALDIGGVWGYKGEVRGRFGFLAFCPQRRQRGGEVQG